MSTEEDKAATLFKETGQKKKTRNKKKAASKKPATKRLIPKVGDIAHHVYFPDAAKPAVPAFAEFVIEEVKQHPKKIALLKEHPESLDDVWIRTVKGWTPLHIIPLSKADAINRVKQSIAQARPYYTQLVDQARQKLKDTIQQTAHQVDVDTQRLEALDKL